MAKSLTDLLQPQELNYSSRAKANLTPATVVGAFMGLVAAFNLYIVNPITNSRESAAKKSAVEEAARPRFAAGDTISFGDFANCNNAKSVEVLITHPQTGKQIYVVCKP